MCSYHHHLMSEYFHHSRKKPNIQKPHIILLAPCLPKALDNPNLYVSEDLLTWIFYTNRIIHTICVLCKILSLNPVFEVMCLNTSFLYYCPGIFHCMDMHTFCLANHQLMDFWIVSIFLTTINNVAMGIHIQGFVSTCVFRFLGHIPGSGIAELHGNFMFNIFKNCPLVSKGAITCYRLASKV